MGCQHHVSTVLVEGLEGAEMGLKFLSNVFPHGQLKVVDPVHPPRRRRCRSDIPSLCHELQVQVDDSVGCIRQSSQSCQHIRQGGHPITS